ncbi:MAG: hypothetical protein PF572_00150 [Patescibacteria group bacterium]|nr:hypothetical protein [Patescibacteria group bacterium]
MVDNQDSSVAIVYDKYLLVEGYGKTEKIFGAEKYFSDIEPGDILRKVGKLISLEKGGDFFKVYEVSLE